MTHQQILDKLASKYLIQSIDEDLRRLVSFAMFLEENNHITDQFEYIFPRLMLRWNCTLHTDKDIVTDAYKQKTILSLCIQLHKYGFADKDVTKKALIAIDALNKYVALSDEFYRKSEEIKKLINSTPVRLKRKPTIPENITFFREKDVISIQLENQFYVAYIHGVTGINGSPIIEFYNTVFSQVPTIKELEGIPAKGQLYSDGIEYTELNAFCGIKYLPDPANQIQLIGSCIEKKPSSEHLKKSTGLYAVRDLFDLQRVIKELFADKP